MNRPPFGPNHPEEYQSLCHEAHWLVSDSRNEGDTAGRNDKGLVTIDRQVKKDAFFWDKANWRNWSEPDGRVVYYHSIESAC